MDTDILFEFCYIQEDVLKDRLAIFMRAISVMQNKAVELEADLDSRLDTPFRSGRDVIDGYWKLYTDICEAYNDISKYQYVNIRYFQYYIIETMFFASVFKKTCKISQKNRQQFFKNY